MMHRASRSSTGSEMGRSLALGLASSPTVPRRIAAQTKGDERSTDAKVRGIVVPSATRSHIGLAPLHGSWSFGEVEELLARECSDRARAVDFS